MDMAVAPLRFLAYLLFYMMASARNNPLLIYWKYKSQADIQ